MFGEEDCMQKSIVCEACKVFDVPYAHFGVSITNARKSIKSEFDIVYFLGGSWRVCGGSFPPAPPSR